MAFLSDRERRPAEALARLTYANPFLPERVELEARVLGERFVPTDEIWHPGEDAEAANPNLPLLAEAAEALAGSLRERLRAPRAGGEQRPREEELLLYRDVVLYTLYQRWEGAFLRAISGGGKVSWKSGPAAFQRFQEEIASFLHLPALEGLPPLDPAHLFACFSQVRRAFHFIFRSILGRSMPAARLRAEVWQSIFTHDLKRYQISLFRVMGDITTLITGPSGTGKELVARAIGLSRYLPFDAGAGSFTESFEGSFFPLNLSALSPTLIESELFGHRRGSFTGAVEDRQGWFEVCPPLGTVFLDEIGELEAAIQVKLLRVLETRSFERLGETSPRRFAGKVIAATNRDLAREMGEGRFREDLYYRLCADTIATPSLAERIASSPEELRHLTFFLARQAVGAEDAAALTDEVVGWIGANLGPEYPWPGNVRELGQCVRNILIRREYRPARMDAGEGGGAAEGFAREVLAGGLGAEELLDRYITLVYARTGSYTEVGRRLGLDRRTVKARLDQGFLAELGKGG